MATDYVVDLRRGPAKVTVASTGANIPCSSVVSVPIAIVSRSIKPH